MQPDRRNVARMLAAASLASVVPIRPAMAQAPAEPVQPHPTEAEILNEAPSQVSLERDESFRMLAPVRINGHGPFQFLVDTGANRSCIRREVADELALPAGPLAAVSTVARRSLTPTVIVDELHVGERVQRRVKVPLLRMAGEETTHGILGVDWLKGRRLVLDFKSRMLEIAAPRSEANTAKRVIVPARRRSGQLTLVDADASGRKIAALIDSGSELTLGNNALRRMVAETGRGSAGPPQRVSMVTVVGETFHGDLMYVPFIRLGGLNIGNVPVVFTESHIFDLWNLKTTPTVVLGMDLLSEFTSVALDFGRSTVRFEIA
jgi:predicted aspartyl protease